MKEDKTWSIDLVALRELKPGEEITITYMDVLAESVKLEPEYTFMNNEGKGDKTMRNADTNVDESVYGVSLVSTR